MLSCSARRRLPWLALALVLTLLQGCATVPGGSLCDDSRADPFEPVNRKIFAFDLALDGAVIKPAAKAYRAALPEFVRDRIHAFLDNLKQPLVFANDVLQGRGGAAGETGKRFVVNSTLGMAGLFDRATGLGLKRQSGDFGQTLHAWGAAEGPYLVLPLLGPSNVRDAIGLGVEVFASPTGQIGSADVSRDVSISTGIADGLDLRERNIETLDELEKSSLDFYTYLRSVTRQNRQATLAEATGRPNPCQAPADALVDPGAPEPAAAAPLSPAASAPITPPSPSPSPR